MSSPSADSTRSAQHLVHVVVAGADDRGPHGSRRGPRARGGRRRASRCRRSRRRSWRCPVPLPARSRCRPRARRSAGRGLDRAGRAGCASRTGRWRATTRLSTCSASRTMKSSSSRSMRYADGAVDDAAHERRPWRDAAPRHPRAPPVRGVAARVTSSRVRCAGRPGRASSLEVVVDEPATRSAARPGACAVAGGLARRTPAVVVGLRSSGWFAATRSSAIASVEQHVVEPYSFGA